MRVVEMSTALQGPGAGGYLADMGAEVIRVEKPEGDGSRYGRGVNNDSPPGTPGAQFVSTSRGKKSLSIDANSEMGREAILRLVDTADAFISNFREAALERMGFGYGGAAGAQPAVGLCGSQRLWPKGAVGGAGDDGHRGASARRGDEPDWGGGRAAGADRRDIGRLGGGAAVRAGGS